MKTQRKTSDKLKVEKLAKALKPGAAAKSSAVGKQGSRQKAGIVSVIGVARKVSKKKAVAARPAKVAKAKPVRDDFKMPASDYALIEALKQRALEFNRPTKKNELLRAGLHALGAMDNTQLEQRLVALGPSPQKKALSKPAKSSKAKA